MGRQSPACARVGKRVRATTNDPRDCSKVRTGKERFSSAFPGVKPCCRFSTAPSREFPATILFHAKPCCAPAAPRHAAFL